MAKATAAILPSPDFTFVPGLTPLIAGLRLYREETYRLEGQIIERKLVVHNYVHGGAGITMSWGCALAFDHLRMMQESGPINQRSYADPIRESFHD